MCVIWRNKCVAIMLKISNYTFLYIDIGWYWRKGLDEDRNDSINNNIIKKKNNPFEHSRCSSAYEIVFSHCKKNEKKKKIQIDKQKNIDKWREQKKITTEIWKKKRNTLIYWEKTGKNENRRFKQKMGKTSRKY